MALQPANLLPEGHVFTGTGRIDRSQQRPDGSVRRGPHNNFIRVALNPTVVFHIARGALGIHFVQPLGDTAGLMVPLMPCRTSAGQQTLIHRDASGVGQPLLCGMLTLQADGLLIEAVGAAVAVDIGAATGEHVGPHPRGDPATVFAGIAILDGFALPIEHSDHNKSSHQPFRNLRFPFRPLFGVIGVRLPETLARPSSPTSPSRCLA